MRSPHRRVRTCTRLQEAQRPTSAEQQLWPGRAVPGHPRGLNHGPPGSLTSPPCDPRAPAPGLFPASLALFSLIVCCLAFWGCCGVPREGSPHRNRGHTCPLSAPPELRPGGVVVSSVLGQGAWGLGTPGRLDPPAQDEWRASPTRSPNTKPAKLQLRVGGASCGSPRPTRSVCLAGCRP